MNLNEKNYVLASALDDIKYIVTEHCGGHPDYIEAQYDCNKAAFDQIAKILANAMRLDVFGGDLPKETSFTSFGRTLKMPVISMPGKATIKYHTDAPELPRLAAFIDTVKSDDGKASCDCTIFVGKEVLADMRVYRGKHFALALVRKALKGAMSRLGKRRRLTANRRKKEGK